MKNFLPRTFWLTLLVITALLIQYNLPTFTLETGLLKKWVGMETNSEDEYLPMRKVDLLSDLRNSLPEEEQLDSTLIAQLEIQPTEMPLVVVSDTLSTVTDSTVTDSTIANDSLRPQEPRIVFHDTVKVPEGVVEIIDYGYDSQLGMDRFYAALNHAKERPIRIGFFGDSFIEGDILTGWLRVFLQQEYGGKGVGYVEIAPETAGFRTTVTHRHKGWTLHQWLNKKTFQKKNQGLSCHYYTAKGKAWMEGTGVKRFYGAEEFDETSFYFCGRQHNKIRLTANDTTIDFERNAADSLQTLTFKSHKPMKKARWELVNEDSTSIFFGMSMDGKNGIVLDNLSMRGQSGTQLSTIPFAYLQQMHKIRNYDLIVLQFGLNVAGATQTNFSKYQHDMERVVNYMHEAYPEAGFLILSVGDRSYKNKNGERVTMPGVKNLSMYQQNVAIQTKTAFWNMLDAMKQAGGIDSMVKAKPALANTDYTHINFRGGRIMATKLFEAIKTGKGQYDRRCSFIEEKRKEMEHETK